MGATCCKSKIDEGLDYDDEFYKDFYNKEPNIESNIANSRNPIQVKSNTTITNTVSFNPPKSNHDLEVSTNTNNKSLDILTSLKLMNTEIVNGQAENLTSNKKQVGFVEPKGINGIQKKDVSKGKVLVMTVKESKFNKIGDILRIDSSGLINSKRAANDGVVIFGHRTSPSKDNIDYSLHQEEGINEKHFEIKYDKVLNTFFLRNQKNSGVFIKIENSMILKDGMIISFGTNHIHVYIVNKESQDQKEVPSIIKFKAIYGPNKGNE